MKARDLMIGDYVTFKDCQYDSPVIIEIVALGFQDEGEDDCLVNIGHSTACDILELDDEIVGLPLTPEILEKNGFVGHRGDYYFSIDHQLAGDGIVTDYITYYQNKRLSIHYADGEISIHCNFVHELQHALRLCGIEKEIDL